MPTLSNASRDQASTVSNSTKKGINNKPMPEGIHEEEQKIPRVEKSIHEDVPQPPPYHPAEPYRSPTPLLHL